MSIDPYQMITGHQWHLYDVPEHEVLISFNNDHDASEFYEWWAYYGKESFEDYFIANNG